MAIDSSLALDITADVVAGVAATEVAVAPGVAAAAVAAAVGHDRVWPLGAQGSANTWMADGVRSLGGYHPAKLAQYEQITRETETEAAAKARFMVGEIAFGQKKYEEAIEHYLEVAVGYPYKEWQALARYETGRCFAELGDKDKAIAARKKVLGMVAADKVAATGYHMPFPAIGYVETTNAHILKLGRKVDGVWTHTDIETSYTGSFGTVKTDSCERPSRNSPTLTSSKSRANCRTGWII